MHPDKSPGPDGMNPCFFQKFWSVVGLDMFQLCNHFLLHGSFPTALNETLLILIPKKKQVESMSDLRPIALCNVAYKILAKLLANRLKRLLPGIIYKCQGAFICGRSIIDNVMLAFEISHSMHQKRSKRNGLAALKLDISKVYDRVEWGFLKAIMLRMGFNETWVDRIMFCVSRVSYTVCHNSEPIGSVVPQRGLKQAHPLSPYLFILCAEGLSSLLQAKVDQGMIHGYSVARNSPQISHPFFCR